MKATGTVVNSYEAYFFFVDDSALERIVTSTYVPLKTIQI